MNDHERVHIDSLVHEACDLLCQTAIQRLAGPTNVLRQIRTDPEGDGVWLTKFARMFLAEHALNTDAGACVILEAYADRPMPTTPGLDGSESIGRVLREKAMATFADLVRLKAEQALELASMQESGAEGVRA